ncbi:hypothetical protein IV498_14955 [Paenarthrobacter sp. Z7-10]|uniref:hypothetical protein n=1 Tax=Paenarthrobacter sp. Z7-10 TaxID=2787635 RepID=UPI0022A9BE94|nr:hypothetical protein [Paenarthrobacter sp. Z7-10]MCZ2404439.1 hypothetical protein [Paenarthrobacter sp. Z7-10]
MMTKNLPHDDAAESYRRHRRLIRTGQVLMIVGVLVALSHWIAHITINGGPPVIQDLLIGYPTGGGIIVLGAILAGRTMPKKR